VNLFRIFKLRYDQIVAVVESPQPERLIDLPISLRQILADGNPLVHQVNQQLKVKLLFTVGLSIRQRDEEMVALGLPLPNTHFLCVFPPNEPKISISLGKLLAFEAVKINDNYYSFNDLLDACANKLGGVHFDPKGDKHEVVRDIRELGEFLERHGIGSTFSTLLLLARTALSGLRPLNDAFERSNEA
jgi:hypothetical protein